MTDIFKKEICFVCSGAGYVFVPSTKEAKNHPYGISLIRDCPYCNSRKYIEIKLDKE